MRPESAPSGSGAVPAGPAGEATAVPADTASAAGAVLVTTRSFGAGDADPAGVLAAAGLRVVPGPVDHDPAALAELLGDAVAWIAGTAPITARHLDFAPRLRVVARYGTGVDAVDLHAARARGIVVTNTPGANAEAVADHTVALMLAALRHVVDQDQAVRAGRWQAQPGRELGALTVGLVGFGAVGRGVARRLAGFGATVLVHDPYVAPDELHTAGVQPAPELAALAARAQLVSLHLPGGGGRPVVDAAFLAHLPAGAVLVNTARGDLVDEAAVAAALAEGRLGAAAVDVLASEPAAASPLLDAPNTIVTPHAAGQTVEAIDRMGMTAAEEVVRVLVGEAPLHPVAVPPDTNPTASRRPVRVPGR
jgi:D-3-phosphoglycerate dehydrogenase / 2-oxoglutarate reductase